MMARYERNAIGQGEFLSINVYDQFDETSREYYIKHFIEQHVDERCFDAYYRNDETGRKVKHPKDMIAAILYGHITGNRSGRKIEELLQTHIGFMYVSNRLNADHSVICEFKIRFTKEIKELLSRLLYILNNLGKIDWDIVVGDGSKIKANAAKWRNVGKGELTDKKLERYRRMSEQIIGRDAETEESFRKGEMEEYKYQDEKRKTSRQKKLYENMVKEIVKYQKGVAAGEIDKDERYNLTDPESRVMLGSNHYSYIQGYNAKFTISNNDIILDYEADTLHEKYSSQRMIDVVEEKKRSLGVIAGTKYLFDSGYENMASILNYENKGIDVYIDTRERSFSDNVHKRNFFNRVEKKADGYYLRCIGNREVKGSKIEARRKIIFNFRRKGCKECINYSECYKNIKNSTEQKSVSFDLLEVENKESIDKYIKKLKSIEGQKIYHKRIGKEHVFANIKNQKGYYQTAYRGLEKVNAELSWICLAHNLMKYVNIQLQG